jgi:hypothetical protein
MGSINIYFFQLLSSFIITSHCTLLSIEGILQLRSSTCHVIYRLFLKQKIIKRNITKRDFFVFFVDASLQKKKYLNRTMRLFAVINGRYHCLKGEYVRFPDSIRASTLKDLPDSKLLMRSHGHLSRIFQTSN